MNVFEYTHIDQKYIWRKAKKKRRKTRKGKKNKWKWQDVIKLVWKVVTRVSQVVLIDEKLLFYVFCLTSNFLNAFFPSSYFGILYFRKHTLLCLVFSFFSFLLTNEIFKMLNGAYIAEWYTFWTLLLDDFSHFICVSCKHCVFLSVTAMFSFLSCAWCGVQSFYSPFIFGNFVGDSLFCFLLLFSLGSFW